MSKPFFSIGMIFKNEIRCLERCMKSLEPLRKAVPCELVMADTGSTDGSREIAGKYADILFDFPWVDDFSAARNAVMDRCSGEWYFTIDADEWLTGDITELIEFSRAKSLPHDLGAVNIHNYNTVKLDENGQFNDFSGIRLLRMSTGIRYTGCIHEKWRSPDGSSEKAMMLYNTWLNHDGYAYANKAAEQAKRDRNMALLRKKLMNDPEDMQTLVECIDISKFDAESVEYARKVVEVIRKKPPHWEKFGPVVFRGAVSVGKLQNLPELREWIDEAMEWFPDSIYTRVDVAYYALANYFDSGDYAESIRWGEIYQDALAKYRAGEYDHSELLRGALEYSASFWERKVYILTGHAYLEVGQPEKAFASLQNIKGEEITDLKQIESITHIMMRLHRTSMLDSASLMRDFWKDITQPVPDEDIAKKRRESLLAAAMSAFSTSYRDDEQGREDFCRHACEIFIPLKGLCVLGDAAAIMQTEDAQAIAEILAEQEDYSKLPGGALARALNRGVRFPLPNCSLSIEKMDILAARLSEDKKSLLELAFAAVKNLDSNSRQELMWARGLVIASVRSFVWKEQKQHDDVTFHWGDEEQNREYGMALAKAFAEVERKFLPFCYSTEVLAENGLFALPPMHRFGWYCGKAFDALDAGDVTDYVRLLREGLSNCEGMKDMVEFLMQHTPELQTPPPSAEMLTLAEQIRTVLTQFAPDDPAVAMLKQSEAYQKVAYFIEGLEPPIVGGQLQ